MLVSNIQINIKFFGGFRKFGESIDLSVPSSSSVPVVKEVLIQALEGKDKLLIDASVLANDNTILRDDAVFYEDTQLSILPPVCGG
jgi:molybdopterin converting factor small subunit